VTFGAFSSLGLLCRLVSETLAVLENASLPFPDPCVVHSRCQLASLNYSFAHYRSPRIIALGPSSLPFCAPPLAHRTVFCLSPPILFRCIQYSTNDLNCYLPSRILPIICCLWAGTLARRPSSFLCVACICIATKTSVNPKVYSCTIKPP
jgi:hypothetical protein